LIFSFAIKGVANLYNPLNPWSKDKGSSPVIATKELQSIFNYSFFILSFL